MTGISILGLGTALPEHSVTAAEARDLARTVFAEDFRDLERMLRVFDAVGVRCRRIARPVHEYEVVESFPRKNEVYARVAREISRRAGAAALEAAGLSPRDVRGVVFVSSTGILAPGLDAALIVDLDLARNVMRVPIWGLGCAGGGGGLGRAVTLAAGLGAPVLLVCAEVCSATFVHADRTRANLISLALFGDGAAAAVVGPGAPENGPQVVSTFSRLFDDTEDIMGWDLVDGGLKVRFASRIPRLVREETRGVVAMAADLAGVSPGAIEQFVMHPGGPRVLDAYADALGLSADALEDAWAVLSEHGNMSSPTVLFVLDRFLRRVPPTEGLALLMGLGPGFCAEGVILRW